MMSDQVIQDQEDRDKNFYDGDYQPTLTQEEIDQLTYEKRQEEAEQADRSYYEENFPE